MSNSPINYNDLTTKIHQWAEDLGFAQVGFSDVDLSEYEEKYNDWLANDYHGEMDYMSRHGSMRTRPDELVEGTLSCISVRMNYLPENAQFAKILKQPKHAYISRYALGRDYHKLMRKRLKALGTKISEYCEEFNFRPFVDSAPVLERPLAEKAGLGWIGKHSLVINKEAGSWFFLGELLVDIPLPTTNNPVNDCGKCVSCIKICPTGAIVEPYVVDSRRCISYLTIELKGSIPTEFRPLIGNRIYGCDDCQLICPWNKFAKLTELEDFNARNDLDNITLLELFSWNEAYFLRQTEGSPIRRIGFDSWQRNIAIALGNAPHDTSIIESLTKQLESSSAMVTEHIEWALEQQHQKKTVQLVQNERLTARLIRTVEKGLPRDA
jgi:epoxyqueuosine reductase